MRNILPLILLAQYVCLSLNAQISSNSQWTWVKGDTIGSQNGVYGISGIPNTANKPGGRIASASWTDSDGNFWLFGGAGYAATNSSPGFLNDLWKYNLVTNQWTWIKGDNNTGQAGIYHPGVYGIRGVPNSANVPGGRYGCNTWTDSKGNFWLFGGTGYSTTGGFLNDLWKYTPATNQWTWMNGINSGYSFGVYGSKGVGAAENTPGGRKHGVSWIDNDGNFWLFGGNGFTETCTDCFLNDLWKYNPNTNLWTWVSGEKEGNKPGVYGIQGVGTTTNIPGSRYAGISWKDENNSLWLYSGSGFDLRTDLWKYDISTNIWTWMKGDTIPVPTVYGLQGIPDPANHPGEVTYSISWTDKTNNLCFYSGYGAIGVWKYTPSVNMWTWVKGKLSASPAVYNLQGIPDSANQPGTREKSCIWIDSAENLWLFGGNEEYLNDLWRLSDGSANWLGAADDRWENPANWSTGLVPDSTTNVVINKGSITVNSNAVCKKLKVSSAASLTIKTGFRLVVMN